MTAAVLATLAVSTAGWAAPPSVPTVRANVPPHAGLALQHRDSALSTKVQSCQASHFLFHLKTDKASYSTGETVQISLSIRNTGPPCSGLSGNGPCVDRAIVSTASGQAVWVSNPGVYACPAQEPQTIPSGSRDSDSFSWTQDECSALGSQCTNEQVPPGEYSVVGEWDVSEPAVQSKPVKITIASPLGNGPPLFSHAPRHLSKVAKTITVTEADEGHHYTLHKGGSLIVELSDPNLTWTEPTSSNQAVLERTSGLSGSTAKATFLAVSSGNATVNAMGYPNCSPTVGCPEYILEFMVSVTVSS